MVDRIGGTSQYQDALHYHRASHYGIMIRHIINVRKCHVVIRQTLYCL